MLAGAIEHPRKRGLPEGTPARLQAEVDNTLRDQIVEQGDEQSLGQVEGGPEALVQRPPTTKPRSLPLGSNRGSRASRGRAAGTYRGIND